jgi:hypothetical protein
MKTILKLLLVLIVALILAWLVYWQGIKYTDHIWLYSENSAIRAAQYLLHTIWGFIFVTSPAWWLGCVVLTFKLLLLNEKGTKTT